MAMYYQITHKKWTFLVAEFKFEIYYVHIEFDNYSIVCNIQWIEWYWYRKQMWYFPIFSYFNCFAGICAGAGVLAIGVTVIVIVFAFKYKRAKEEVEGKK